MDTNGVRLRRSVLFKLKLRAVRSGVWFKVVSSIDRALMNAVLQVVNDGVRSLYLARAMSSVVTMLNDMLRNQARQTVNAVGFQLARKLGQIALGWGNASAIGWLHDVSFASFLGVMHANDCGRGFTF